ncbi:GDP-mannose 4,6-dehydratase [Burkholderia multivorans]|uniref:GDP-mannose 4,6-dehydratase n=1 Tax=Burkholderia multivorans TaxID=87883 RepID=UPI0009B952A4|nr:GDP-mannose 4,6-dehydratase [Burkholderia multivorans]MBU9239562.1 GDP-mannose 4,6-dehydratase [Burkholderia multivorans]MDN7951119.1 GDP-mannose 4,6-dehydratase [Burkholderia multivorans]MDN8031079.1 GDP-mannose 4,6-dehydratase [Burkholderia multivorans]HEF4749175.1 GDP-mannose 4,6-dehydratase [Burkholderia multivorans]HEM7811604.1 GDP-mannose 4,6-dehydratase [Burkholderia multivorans]
MILVTGGAGFIEANFVLGRQRAPVEALLNVDKLTYARPLRTLRSFEGRRKKHMLARVCVGGCGLTHALFPEHKSRALHFPAENQVGRSVRRPPEVVWGNVVGTVVLLKAPRQYWNGLYDRSKTVFYFLYVSTDEVFGSSGATDSQFFEAAPYAPNGWQLTTKAGSDRLVCAYLRTYCLLTRSTNCANSYGRYRSLNDRLRVRRPQERTIRRDRSARVTESLERMFAVRAPWARGAVDLRGTSRRRRDFASV